VPSLSVEVGLLQTLAALNLVLVGQAETVRAALEYPTRKLPAVG
jgi:hypothetical protein